MTEVRQSYSFVEKAYLFIKIHETALDRISIVNIFISLGLIAVSTDAEFMESASQPIYLTNFLVILFFAFEFCYRFYDKLVEIPGDGSLLKFKNAAKDGMLYVDFAAFFPELVALLIGATVPEWVKLLRLFRLFKLARHFQAMRVVLDVIQGCWRELAAAFSLALILWYLSALALYYAEGSAQPEAFGNIWLSMWWSVVTLTTVGYGDVYPITTAGKVVAGSIAFLGLGTVALPSGIIAGKFMDEIAKPKE
ncbi:MAG: ion transporter [Sphingomonadales bacterium]|jgi:voltage-gated potassium channel